jgi:hypothetical protein
VQITGKADSEDFAAYRVEYGLGNPPLEWKLLIRSETKQPGGGLALWNLDGLPAGTYTLRVVLEDRKRGELSTFVIVTIGESSSGGGGTPGATPVPRPRITPTVVGIDDF